MKQNKTGSSKSSGIRHDNNGCAYTIDSETNQAILLAANSPTSPVSALSALANDPLPKEWFNSLTPIDQFEYHSLFTNDFFMSVDWNERRRTVPSDVLLASPPSLASRTNLSVSYNSFILDSGASIHLSPETTDFYNLKPIPPRSIKGVGG